MSLDVFYISQRQQQQVTLLSRIFSCKMLASSLVLFLTTVTGIYCKTTQGNHLNIFASTFQMQSLLQAEMDFVKAIQRDKLNQWQVKFYQDYYHSSFLENDTSYEDYVSHPINAFGIISRTSQAKELFETNSIFPSKSDFISVCSALILIQESQDLKTMDLIQGKIKDGDVIYQSQFKPGFFEMASLGVVACNNKWFDICIEWLQAALTVNICLHFSCQLLQ